MYLAAAGPNIFAFNDVGPTHTVNLVELSDVIKNKGDTKDFYPLHSILLKDLG